MCFPSLFCGIRAGKSGGRAQTNEGACVMVAKAGKAFRVAWPLAGIGLAVAVNAVWIGAVGYGVSKLF
jgi:hypothetical protein